MLHKVDFEFEIKNIDICPTYPYVSFVGTYKKQSGEFKDNEFIIYDLESHKKFNADQYMAVHDSRWSING